MHNRAHGFLDQEFSDSPDVVEMIIGVLACFGDLHIHFEVGVKNHTQVSHWRHRYDLCSRIQAAVYFLQSRILSCCHSSLASWKSASSSDLLHNFQWQWLRLFDSWKEWLWMTGKLDGHQHSHGLLAGAFLWFGKGRQYRWWTAQGQCMIPVVLQWSAVSFLKEFL